METVFSLSSLLVMPFWLLMIFAPNWSWTQRIIGSLWICVPVALLYAVMVVPSIPAVIGDLLNPTLEGVNSLLSTPAGTTLAWVHFLAFDLFVGRWAYLDSRKNGFSAWLTSPVLFFILMFGPFGWLLYLALCTFKKGISHK